MESSVHKGFMQTSDFFLFISVAVGAICEYFFPSSFESTLDYTWTLLIGIILLMSGWLIIILTKRELKKFSQQSKPGVPTQKLVTTGIFSYSRNPIYVGIVLINVAVGLIVDSLWILLFSPLLMIMLLYMLVIPEEKYLKSVFGDEYANYMRKVRRWM